MGTKTKYYVVWKGRKKGIFHSWEECRLQVGGFPSAEFMAFDTLRQAELAMGDSYKSAQKKRLCPAQIRLLGTDTPMLEALAVDGACSGNPGPMEYRGVHVGEQEEIFHCGPIKNGTNNIAEFLAIVHALAYLKRQSCDWPIYSDSKTAMEWIRLRKCRTRLPMDDKHSDVHTRIQHAEEWLATHDPANKIMAWDTEAWGENPADFGRKG